MTNDTHTHTSTAARFIVSEPTLRRLPWYLAFVSLMVQKGVAYVSSTTIAKETNVDAARVAKDLAMVGLRGKTRIGYETSALEAALRHILGFGVQHPAVIMGVGSLGAALVADSGLSRFGLDIVAGFDINPAVIGTHIGGVPIYHISQLEEIIDATHAQIGVVAVPAESARLTASRLFDVGIKALWNFTPVKIPAREDTVIENTSLYAHLAVMYNRLNSLTSSDE